ncbi:MAG: Tat-binding 7, partial [Trebouxia sp. A1-2]
MRHVRECTLCGHPEGFATDVLGHLIGPIGENARSKQPLWVHRECAIWSPEAFEIGNSRIRGISKALKRGRVTWCARCQKRGATMGCRLDQCPRSFHKYCAQQAGCTFYPNHYLIACKDHAHMYKADVPPAGQTPMSPYSPYPLPGGLPAGQLTPGMLNGSAGQGIKRLRDTPPEERMRNARRAVKRLRHEMRVTQAAGSDDEEHFQKKDKARLARDKLRLNPVVL